MNRSTVISYILIYLVLIAIGLISCVDIIELDTGEQNEVLIIEGMIYNGDAEAKVEVRSSASFVAGAEGVEEPVSGALVTIDQLGGASFTLSEKTPGIYTTDQIVGIPGREYVLHVDVNGKSYFSLPEKMPQPVLIEALSSTFRQDRVNTNSGNVIDQDIFLLKASADFSEVPGNVFLRYRVGGIWEFHERFSNTHLFPINCYISEEFDLNNLALVDGREVSKGKLVEQEILEKIIDEKFTFNYCLTVFQHSITNNAFNFWLSVQNEFERTGDIFEAPPARIKGNMFNSETTKNDVIGLFSAISVDSAKVLINRGQFPFVIRGYCMGFPDNPEICFDCLQIHNSTTTRPDCF